MAALEIRRDHTAVVMCKLGQGRSGCAWYAACWPLLMRFGDEREEIVCGYWYDAEDIVFCRKVAGRTRLEDEKWGFANDATLESFANEKLGHVPPTYRARSPVFGIDERACLPGGGAVRQEPRADNSPIKTTRLDHLLLHVLIVVDALQCERKDDRIVEEAAMPSAVASPKAGHGEKAFDVQGTHGIDENARRLRKERRAAEQGLRTLRRTERVDYRIDASHSARYGGRIERISLNLLELWLIDGDTRCRACKSTNAMAIAKRTFHRLQPDASARADDQQHRHCYYLVLLTT